MFWPLLAAVTRPIPTIKKVFSCHTGRRSRTSHCYTKYTYICVCDIDIDIFVNCSVWLTPGGSSTLQIYTQTIHTSITTELTTNCEECGKCPLFVSYIPAFALQLREKHEGGGVMYVLYKTMVRSKNSDQYCSCIIDFYTLEIDLLMMAANNGRNI
jgi:hypothetical protein